MAVREPVLGHLVVRRPDRRHARVLCVRVLEPHHDLGLYELALLAALLAGSVLLLRTPRRPGWIVAVVAIAYATPRFFLDFSRRESTDPRYHGLTPAQWSCIATVAAGLALLAWIYTHPEAPPERYLDATPWRVHLRDFFRVRRRRAGVT